MMIAVQDNPPPLAPKSREEISGNAQRLVSVMGEDALAYAQSMSAKRQDIGNDKDQVFWKMIADQIALLLDDPVSGPERN